MSEEKKPNVVQLFQKSLAMKIVVIMGAVVLIGYAVYVAFSGSKSAGQGGPMVAPPQGNAAQLGQASTPAYGKALNEDSVNRADAAKKEGTSSLATPVVKEEDPLDKYRTKPKDDGAGGGTSTPAEREAAAGGQKGQGGQGGKTNDEILAQMQNAVRKDIDNLRKASALPASLHMMAVLPSKSSQDNLVQVSQQVVSGAGVAGAVTRADAGASQQQAKKEKPLIDAGQEAYGQILTEANSDLDSPVLASIVSGPLAGARAIGSFKSTEDLMVISFKTASLNGVQYDIDAVALDPDDAKFAFSDDVDHHYIERLVLPAAAAFLTGYGDAASRAGSSILVNGASVTSTTTALSPNQELFAAGGKAASSLGNMFDRQAQATKPTVMVHAGRAVGILFLKPVEAK